MAGRRIVEMVHEDLKLSKILTREAFENAITTLAAIGGSTNAVIHLHRDRAAASASSSTLDDWDRLGSELPCLVNLQPSGKYLMEDFYYAGGLPAVMKEICAALLHLDALTVNGKTHRREHRRRAELQPRGHQAVRRRRSRTNAGIAVLRGNLAPRRRGHQAVARRRRR